MFCHFFSVKTQHEVHLPFLFLALSAFLSSTPYSPPLLKQPYPCKKEEYRKGEREPGSPADARATLGHAEHPIHGASEAVSSVVEAVVHVGGEGGGGGDFGGNGEGNLFNED